VITAYSEFAGYGGDGQGLAVIPGVELAFAGNHKWRRVAVHAANFPNADHACRDVTKADVAGFPRVDFYWASPACPPWSNARGVKRDFDSSNQLDLFGKPNPDARRALMEEVPRYLRAMNLRGKPVLAGVVENVVECRQWDQWPRWRAEIHAEGYDSWLIALNSMHAVGVRTRRAPQSRNRLFLAYRHRSLGRNPDWNKWLRPPAWCASCDRQVNAIQVFKKPGVDMGIYGKHGQYVYRCPSVACRNSIVEPGIMPAAAAIDLTNIGQRIGDRPKPLQPNTLRRIEDSLRKHGRRWALVPAGGTWNDVATLLADPMRARTTRDTEALLVPVEGRGGVYARPVTGPMRAQTARQQDALVHLPVVATLRGGGSTGHSVADPLATFSAGGTHHALIHQPQFVYSYDTGRLRDPHTEPLPTQTSIEGDALLGPAPAVDDCHFRMLTPAEIAAGMAFRADYRVPAEIDGKKVTGREQVAGYGDAVTPPCAEVIGSALVECITGSPLDREVRAA
jgi:DNA (cytosine-5)-methyltransferase 1